MFQKLVLLFLLCGIITFVMSGFGQEFFKVQITELFHQNQMDMIVEEIQLPLFYFMQFNGRGVATVSAIAGKISIEFNWTGYPLTGTRIQISRDESIRLRVHYDK